MGLISVVFLTRLRGSHKGLGYARQGCKMLGNGQPSGGDIQAMSGDMPELMGLEGRGDDSMMGLFGQGRQPKPFS